MTHAYHFPVKLPRFTDAEFEAKKAAYTAEFGYQVNIPGFNDIIHWNVIPEPSNVELAYYRKKDITHLGDKRYNDIKTLMENKRAAYQRILKSPAPGWLRNSASALTFIDDINDTLGTLGVVCRTLAHALPASLGKLVMGPAGWCFLAADVAGVAMTLARLPLKLLSPLTSDIIPIAMTLTPLPYKTRRLQHELHATLRDHPFSKKARLRRAAKLKRIGLSKGEIIEGLQTTDNIFGYGLCLGPIMGLLYDIPSGLYHHIRGEKVEIMGLPAPLLWFDRIWSNTLKSLAEIFYGSPPMPDEERDKAAIAMHYCTLTMQSVLKLTAELDLIPPVEGVQILPRAPEHPSTIEVIQEYGNDPKKNLGYPSSDSFYQDASHHWEKNREEIASNVRKWMVRGAASTQTMIASQNAVAAGQMAMANMFGENEVEWEYEPVTATLLALYNQGYTFPPNVNIEDVQAWAAHITALAGPDGTVNFRTALDIAKYDHYFSFTTKIPKRPPVSATIPVSSPEHPIEKLRCYFKGWIFNMEAYLLRWDYRLDPAYIDAQKVTIAKHRAWLDYYGWPTTC